MRVLCLTALKHNQISHCTTNVFVVVNVINVPNSTEKQGAGYTRYKRTSLIIHSLSVAEAKHQYTHKFVQHNQYQERRRWDSNMHLDRNFKAQAARVSRAN